MKRCMLLALLIIFTIAQSASAVWIAEFEGGPAWNTKNDIQIPGDTGTRFSLTDSFDVSPTVYTRFRLSYVLPNNRHLFSLLAAPLRFEAQGTAPKDITFYGVTFPEGTDLTGRYRFDSYRITWRYLWPPFGNFSIGAGLTTKIRSAAIKLEGGGLSSERTDNFGIVPVLINISMRYWLSNRFSLIFEADALAVPQGRAEDVYLAVMYYLKPLWNIRLGYRFVEGGSGTDSVYNFSFIQYLSVGTEVAF